MTELYCVLWHESSTVAAGDRNLGPERAVATVDATCVAAAWKGLLGCDVWAGLGKGGSTVLRGGGPAAE